MYSILVLWLLRRSWQLLPGVITCSAQNKGGQERRAAKGRAKAETKNQPCYSVPLLTQHRFVKVGQLCKRWEQVGKIVFPEQSEEKLKPSVLVLLVLPLQAGSLCHRVKREKQKALSQWVILTIASHKKKTNYTTTREEKAEQPQSHLYKLQEG